MPGPDHALGVLVYIIYVMRLINIIVLSYLLSIIYLHMRTVNI
jgi:hypothetical protein